MYGWEVLKSAYGKNTALGDFAARLKYAEVDGQEWEGGNKWWRNIFYLALGFLGL